MVFAFLGHVPPHHLVCVVRCIGRDLVVVGLYLRPALVGGDFVHPILPFESGLVRDCVVDGVHRHFGGSQDCNAAASINGHHET